MPLPSDNPRNRQGNTTATVPETGARVPLSPLTANDLAEQWGISAEAQEEVSVKVHRGVPGARITELVMACPLNQYSLRDLAAEYGPGVYTLTGSGQYARNTASCRVSEDFARAQGWRRQPAEPMTPSGMMAGRALQDLQTRGSADAGGVMLILEKMMEAQSRQQERLERLILERQAPHQAPDIMASLTPALTLIAGIQNNAFSQAAALMAGKVPDAEDAKPWWVDLAGPAISTVGKIVEAVATKNQRPPVAPPAQTLPALPPATPAPTVAPIQETKPMPNPAPSPIDPVATSLLKNAAPQLAQVADAVSDDQTLVMMLENQVPPALYPALEKLNAAVKQNGPQALAFLGPEFVGERWPRLLEMLVTQDDGAGEEWTDEGAFHA